jgi:hypothetical protein
VLLPRKQRVRDLDPLVGRIDVVAAQKASHVIARVMHATHDNQQSGLCLISGMGMKPSGNGMQDAVGRPKTGTIRVRLFVQTF